VTEGMLDAGTGGTRPRQTDGRFLYYADLPLRCLQSTEENFVSRGKIRPGQCTRAQK
jgi:hypothetical protein